VTDRPTDRPRYSVCTIGLIYVVLRCGLMITRMWTEAERDGLPVQYRWRPLFNAAVWLTPTTIVPCSNTAKTRNLLKFAGVPQTGKAISAASGSKVIILSGHMEQVLLFNIFFPIIDTRLSCEDTTRQSCAMVPRWRFFGPFFASCISASRVQHVIFQTCILNSH